MRTAATPAEFERLVGRLDRIDVERQAAIARLVFEVVANCPLCDEPIRRCDSRRLVYVRRDLGRLTHLRCLEVRR